MATKFHYIVDEDFAFDPHKNVASVTFNISRYGKYKFTMRFDELLTEKGAVKVVEQWLSKPVSQDYYEMVKDNLWNDQLEDYGENPCRGNLLTDCKFLEGLIQTSFVPNRRDILIRCDS